MKIAHIEAAMAKGNISDKTMADFKAALKRVPKTSRCQHCYTTAAEIPKKNYLDAIALINLGLNEYCESWIDKMRSYFNLGLIYEIAEDYPNALCAYKHAIEAVCDDHKESYESELAAQMLRVEMHCSGFVYTADLQSYYEIAAKQDEFSKSFMHRLFYQALAEMLIFANNGQQSKAQEAYLRAKAMLSPSYKGPLCMLLLQHKYKESTKATPQAIKFLKSWKA